jgi:UDP-2,3-diacylglucosamine pyrophosphatase LpxH
MKIIISDLHLGCGDVLEDFRFLNRAQTRRKDPKMVKHQITAMHQVFQRFVEGILEAARKSSTTPELILLGDIFDLLQVEPKRFLDPVKIERIASVHKPFFHALDSFTKNGGKLVYVTGNHDHELMDPAMFHALLDHLPELNADHHYKPLSYYVDRSAGIYAEHGNQLDPLNRFRRFQDPHELPFGSQVVLKLVNPYERHYPLIDNIEGTRAQLWYALKNLPGFLSKTLLQSLPYKELPAPLPCKQILMHLANMMSETRGLGWDGEFQCKLNKVMQRNDQLIKKEVLRRVKNGVELLDFLQAGPHPGALIVDHAEAEFSRQALRVLDKKRGKTLGPIPTTLRFLILAHTHRIRVARIADRYYANTGCWRPRAIPYRTHSFRMTQTLDAIQLEEKGGKWFLKPLNVKKVMQR